MQRPRHLPTHQLCARSKLARCTGSQSFTRPTRSPTCVKLGRSYFSGRFSTGYAGSGYVEDRNLIVERYSAEGRNERHAEIVRDVVKSRPDLIFTVTPELARLFKAATTTIPIVALHKIRSLSGLSPASRDRAATSRE